MWHRSTDQAEGVAPPPQPGFGAAPPQAPLAPPATPRRRFVFVVAVMAVVVVVAAGLVVFKSVRPTPATNAVADVRQSFLSYFSALELEAKQLDIAPVRPFLTDAGAKQEQATLAQLVQTGNRFQVTADHDLQIVVYNQGNLASVDDVFVHHTLVLDAKTQVPTGPPRTDTVHGSYALVKQAGHWLVDSVIEFGTAVADQNGAFSYVARSRNSALPPVLRTEVDKAFLAYWAASKTAFATLDSGPLETVEVDPELGQDRAEIGELAQNNRGFDIVVEHNYRVGSQDDTTIWVYDTYADSSNPFDRATKRPVEHLATQIIRKNFELKKTGDTWKIALDTLYQ